LSGEGPMLQAESGRQPGAVQRVRRLLGPCCARGRCLLHLCRWQPEPCRGCELAGRPNRVLAWPAVALACPPFTRLEV
jgi:hypothetical protein